MQDMTNARTAITGVFFVNAALVATWASRIPALSAHVHAGVGVLGLCLLAPAVAAVGTMPVIGPRLPGRSSRSFCVVAVACVAVSIVLPALAQTPVELGLALLAVGAANSSLDVSMNASGVSIERQAQRPILSSLHAAFSFGGCAGAGLGALAAATGLDPLPHFALAATLFGGAGVTAATRLPRSDHDRDAEAPRLRLTRLPLTLVLLGAACFCSLLAEGGASDWSAKLVHGDLGGTAALGAVAYAVFNVAMGTGRLLADRLWSRWGAVRLLRGSGILAAAGLTAGLSVGTAPAAVLAFLALGLGLAGVIPTLFRAAAGQAGVATGPALAAVSSLGYLGFLAGPPIVGGIAQLTSLRLACELLAVSGAVVVLLAGVARSQHPEVAVPPAGAPSR